MMSIFRAYKTSNAIVVYIDILGFSSLMQENRPDLSINNLLTVWEKITHFYKKRKNVVINFFSDSMFIAYLANNSNNKIIENCFEDLEEVYDFYFNSNFFIRGGISYGEISYTANLIVGEPIVKAVKYESQYNPGPIIIFPTVEFTKISKSHTLFSVKKPSQIKLKNQNGIMECYSILPRDINNYILAMKEKQQNYAKNGPYPLAEYWLEQLNFINNYRKKNNGK